MALDVADLFKQALKALSNDSAGLTVVNPDGSNTGLFPAKLALARTLDTTISASTEVTLNASTTIVRIYAITKDVYLKWGTADVTASNFDHVIPAGQICDFSVPTGQTALNVIEREASATVIILEY